MSRKLSKPFERYWERAVTHKDKSQSEKKAGSLIAFFGGKGGVGTTSIAVNLASQLSDNCLIILR